MVFLVAENYHVVQMDVQTDVVEMADGVAEIRLVMVMVLPFTRGGPGDWVRPFHVGVSLVRGRDCRRKSLLDCTQPA